ncbi:MAG: hypothetical protein U0R24_02645 [Solirubrobacterales bacterium]
MNSSSDIRSFVRPLAAAVLAVAVGLTFGALRAHAAFPGDNGDIAYARYFDKGLHIFSYDPATGKSTQLTTNALRGDAYSVAAGHPSFGPTGERIVFTNAVQTKAIGGRRNDVYVMRADGSHVKRLTHTPDGEYLPSFTADGRYVAYSLHGKTYLVRSSGKGKRTELTAELPRGGVGATFSADGTKVAVTSSDGGDSDIFVMDLDGIHASNPVNITASSDAYEYSPDFSPDGSRIAFISDRDDTYGDLFTMAADGSDVVTVAAAEGLEAAAPAYSPDGTQIAYETRLRKSGAIQVVTIPAEGGQPQPLKKSGPVSEEPSWGVG